MSALMASESVVEARNAPIALSINDLLIEYGYPPDSLVGVKHVLAALDKYSVRLDPRFDETGDLASLRTLKAQRPVERLHAEIDEVVATTGENESIELKSSIQVDTRKQLVSPGLRASEYISDKLQLKLAQEIGAFLNEDGGTIYFGIHNDHIVCGCQGDFDAFERSGSNSDKAELIIQRIVDRYFVHPVRVRSNIQVEQVEYQSVPVVILRIVKSPVLELLKKDSGAASQLYLRVGTSAQPIQFEELDHHFMVTRR
jgi:hypothetical protein